MHVALYGFGNIDPLVHVHPVTSVRTIKDICYALFFNRELEVLFAENYNIIEQMQ